ncbi:MAG: hypothetical protein ABIO70_24405 [Pseudomonadota bacterium]
MSDPAASAALLATVRGGMKRRGLNTAALAARVKQERPLVRSVLAGRTPLTVDLLFAMIEALELTPEELGLPPGTVAARLAMEPQPPEPAEPPEPPAVADGPRIVAEEEGAAPFEPDEDAPQAREVLRLGFALGIDMQLVCTTSRLGSSGLPEEILKRFPDMVPLKLDAAYHFANRARYLEEGLELRLSFDRVRTCLLPWSAIRQITLLPEPPEETQEEPRPPEPQPGGGPVLRLVRS